MGQYQDHTDFELMSLLSKDSRVAFAEIYRRFKGPLYIHAYKMLGKHEEAQDVLQDIFVTLWSKRQHIVLETGLAPYLYKAVRYKILNMIGRKRIEKNYLESLAIFLEEGEYVTDKEVQSNELEALIEQEIALLPPRMREIFELSRKKGFSHKQIADALHISDKTVKKQVYNALNILRDKVDWSYLLLLCWL